MQNNPVRFLFIPSLVVLSVNLQTPTLKNKLFTVAQLQFLPAENRQYHMELKDLNFSSCCMDADTLVSDIANQFNKNPGLSGVILTKQGHFTGILSRDRCFEALGRPFGIEIYSRRTGIEFYRQIGVPALILDAATSVQVAVKTALSRKPEDIYDPIVLRLNDHGYGLIDMHTILLAQSELMENLYEEVQLLSTKDPLTNINNRRGFLEAAEPAISTALDHQSDLSAFMVDIDHFKIVNDIYGHFVGDRVICAVAAECQKSIRHTDLLGRFGGEEFMVLLPNTPLETAQFVAERVRSRIENLMIYVDGYQISVTVSIGICSMKDSRESLDHLLTQTDQAMYAAKWSGRNQIITWDALLSQKLRQNGSILETFGDDPARNWFYSHNGATRIYDETIEGWAHALELRDKEAEGHAKRVSNMAVELAGRVGVNEEQLVDIRRGALLHDIGKIAVPDNILFKPGALTEEEWELMRKHPVYAYELLSPIAYLKNSIDIPYCHHEHWDGSGYPRGLKETEIPLSARIFTIIDVWDALSTDRCYRPAWPPDEVKQYIQNESGKLFDPDIVPIFLTILDEKAHLSATKETAENFV